MVEGGCTPLVSATSATRELQILASNMQEVLLLIVLVVTTINVGTHAGEVRCFCNLPRCVTSGYMCKSPSGGCYSDLLDHQDVYKARHGCLELLDTERQTQCGNEPGAVRGAQRSLLLCCHSDMCNHVDSPEIRTRVNNGSQNSQLTSIETRVTAAHSTDTEVWFKAATIAVPICGALILLLLIGLAIKLLRHDAQYPTHKYETQAVASKKAPLLDNNRLDYANECCSNRPKNTNYRDVNVSSKADGKAYDKQIIGLCEKSLPLAHV